MYITRDLLCFSPSSLGPPNPSFTLACSLPALSLFLQTLSSSSSYFFFFFPSATFPFSFSHSNFLFSSSISLFLPDPLVSSSCDITGHCSPLGLDIRPRCQATAAKGLSVSVCERRARARVCLCLSERCVSNFPRLALYLCMKNDQNRSTSVLYPRSKHVDDWAALPLSSTTEEEGCVCIALMIKEDGTGVRAHHRPH